ncbi:MAG: tetratricopeptide repeat protein [Planctomycetota bacterium]
MKDIVKHLGYVLLVLAVGAVLAAYVGRLDNPFLIDDRQTIQESTEIESVASALFPERDTPVAGRPVPSVSLAIDHARAGKDPEAYHRTNLGFHLANTLLVFLLLVHLARLPKSTAWLREHATLVAGWATALWAVHPLHVETILYATQRTELCFATFSLATLVCVARSWSDARRRWIVLAAVSGVLAALSKETAVVVPALALVLDRALVSGSFRAALSRHRAQYLALVPLVLAVVGVVLSDPRADSVEWFSLDYLLTQGVVVWHYFLLVVWPEELIASYGFLVPGASTARVVGLVALTCLAAAGLWLLARRPRAGIFAAWVLGLLAPTSSFAAIHTEVGAARRMYLPLIAFAFVAAWGAARLARTPGARRVAAGLGAIVVVALATRTRVRTADYQDLISLWRMTLEQYPENYGLDFDLATELRLAGDTDGAIASYRNAVAKLPVYKEAHTGLGALLFERGSRDEGLAHLERAFELNNRDAEILNNLGAAYGMLGRMERAEALFLRYVELHPTLPQGRIGLAQVYLSTNRREAAIEELRRAIASPAAGEEARAAIERAKQMLRALGAS